MDSEVLKEIIYGQKVEIEELFRNKKIIEREAGEYAAPYLKGPFIFITTGIRRCGKSIFSLLLTKDKRYGYVNFDDERLYELEAQDLNRVLEALYSIYGDIDYIILDEIQNIPGWEFFANRLQRTKRVVITGSNARLMSHELATHLTGRHIDFVLYPFSFREYLKYNNFVPEIYSTPSRAKIKDYMVKYMHTGGIPDAYEFGDRYLLGLYRDILNRDIVYRYHIRYLKSFFEMARYLISHYAREFSYSRLRKSTKIKNAHTIKNYIQYLENSYLLFEINRFSYRLREQHLAPRKIYCVDTGIANVAGFSMSKDIGHVMENLVAVELKRHESVGHMLSIYYWKDYHGHEVDFVIKWGNSIRELIQVTYSTSVDEIERREINALVKASDQLRCKNLKVITWDYEASEKIKGKKIDFVPLWKWLITVTPSF